MPFLWWFIILTIFASAKFVLPINIAKFWEITRHNIIVIFQETIILIVPQSVNLYKFQWVCDLFQMFRINLIRFARLNINFCVLYYIIYSFKSWQKKIEDTECVMQTFMGYALSLESIALNHQIRGKFHGL